MFLKGRILSVLILAVLFIFAADQAVFCQEEKPKEIKKIALVLGGGGARGAAHVGVLKVMEKNGIKPDIIVGNSMGAIVGGMYCAGVPLDEIEELIRKGEVQEAFKPVPIPIQFFKKLYQKIKFWERNNLPGLYSGAALEKFIRKTIPEGSHEIENLSPRFAATAVDLIDGNAYRIEKGDLSKALRASASFPPLLKPVKIDKHIFTDGGVRSNVPTYAALGMDADYVIAVNVDEKVEKIDESQISTYTELIKRLSSIIVYLRDKELLKKADLIIQPDVEGISIVSVRKEDYKRAIAAGEAATLELLPALKKVFRERHKIASQ